MKFEVSKIIYVMKYDIIDNIMILPSYTGCTIFVYGYVYNVMGRYS